MNLSEIRALMAQYGLRPNKSLGQNFLVDAVHLRRIAAAAQLSEADTVLEIGPGLGPLTELLLEQAGRVIAVELDAGFVRVLTDRFGEHPRFVLHHGDILEQAIPTLLHSAGVAGPLRYKCVANIPYYITSAVMRHLLESAVPPELIVLLMQKEVAQRIVAEPGDLSLLAISVQFYGEPEIVNTVPAGAFYPAPKVDSAILRVYPYPDARYAVEDRNFFWEVVKAGFGQKRKQLRNSLTAGLPTFDRDAVDAALAASSISAKRRAQSLHIDEWVALYEALSAHSGRP